VREGGGKTVDNVVVNIIIWAVIGIVAGWLAGLVTGTGSERNIWGDLVLGLLGALVAGFVLRQTVGPANFWWSIIAAAAVAVVLLLIKNMVTANR
jgi:uncharacterized membrane protein YeaQ/YmgE (transglycosylase-associated protein family)